MSFPCIFLAFVVNVFAKLSSSCLRPDKSPDFFENIMQKWLIFDPLLSFIKTSIF